VRAPEVRRTRLEDDALVAAATAGNESAFAELYSLHRREILMLATRILGSADDAEDIAQETFLRAWQKRQSYQGRSLFRTWLYRIATNACLDALARRRTGRRFTLGSEPNAVRRDSAEMESIAANGPGPDAQIIARETLELALLASIRLMPPKQRATLFLTDALGWSAKDIADLLETTVPSVTSALQRARAKLRVHLPDRMTWAPGLKPSPEERGLLRRLVDAAERADAEPFAEMIAD
jgi:RNA polymerase sigma-70 factor (ECF subfamily)